jgi:hypothetical protein
MAARITNVLVTLIVLGVVGVLGGVVVLTALAATGEVGNTNGCRSEVGDPSGSGEHEVRGVNNDLELAAAWQAKWDAFDAQLDSGQAATVSFSESEVTSRAAKFLIAKEAPVQDIMICFHNGAAEATAKVDVPVLAEIPGIGEAIDAEVRARGTIDFSGPNPQIVITELEAGNMPAEASERVTSEVEAVINDRLDDYNSEHQLSVKFTEGSIEISGQP